VASIIWPILVAAILPLSLTDLLPSLPKIAATLDAMDDLALRASRQVDLFAARSRLRALRC
jgi:hypothetical protein